MLFRSGTPSYFSILAANQSSREAANPFSPVPINNSNSRLKRRTSSGSSSTGERPFLPPLGGEKEKEAARGFSELAGRRGVRSLVEGAIVGEGVSAKVSRVGSRRGEAQHPFQRSGRVTGRGGCLLGFCSFLRSSNRRRGTRRPREGWWSAIQRSGEREPASSSRTHLVQVLFATGG